MKFFNRGSTRIVWFDDRKKLFILGQKKCSFFRKCGWREKISPWRLQIYFFNRFSRDTLFPHLVSLAFLYSCFYFCSFVCFLKLKICILMHIRLWGRVSDKKIFTRPICRNKITSFFGQRFAFLPLCCTFFRILIATYIDHQICFSFIYLMEHVLFSQIFTTAFSNSF